MTFHLKNNVSVLCLFSEQKNCPQREEFVPGQANIKNLSLVNPKKVLLPPLQIKAGIHKKKCQGFGYIECCFSIT
jgi:hypothetical protein